MATGVIRNGKFIHDLYNDEEYAFEQILSNGEDETVFLTGSSEEKIFFKILRNQAEWINNSKNTNNPPDFINPSSKWMLDLMIVNDYEKTTNSGKAINGPAKEGAHVAKEISSHDFSKQFPNVDNIMFEYEDNMTPSYEQYYRNTCRVLDRHTKAIPNYKARHPECTKVAFAVCDTSEHEHLLASSIKPDEVIAGHPCYDKKFLRKIKSCGADILLWFSPYISKPNGNTVKLLVIDVSRLMPEKHGVMVIQSQD